MTTWTISTFIPWIGWTIQPVLELVSHLFQYSQAVNIKPMSFLCSGRWNFASRTNRWTIFVLLLVCARKWGKRMDNFKYSFDLNERSWLPKRHANSLSAVPWPTATNYETLKSPEHLNTIWRFVSSAFHVPWEIPPAFVLNYRCWQIFSGRLQLLL